MRKFAIASLVALTLAACKTTATKDQIVEHSMNKVFGAITAPYRHFSEGSLRSKVLKYNPKAKEMPAEEFKRYADQFSSMSDGDFIYAEETFTKTGTADFDNDGKQDKYTITSTPVIPEWDGKYIGKLQFFTKKNVITIEYASGKNFSYENTGDRIADVKPQEGMIVKPNPGMPPEDVKYYTTTDLQKNVCSRNMGKAHCIWEFLPTK